MTQAHITNDSPAAMAAISQGYGPQTIVLNDAVSSHINSLTSNVRFQNDANGSVFIQRSLEVINANIFETLYGQLKFRGLFPVNDLNNAGVTSYTYIVGDRTGEAKLIGSNVNDLPRANVSGKDVVAPIRVTGTSYAITQQDIASAAFAGIQLMQRKADASRRANEELLNNIAFFGRPDSNLNGVLIDPTIPVGNVAGGIWATKTPDEIIADINTMFSEIVENTLENFVPDTLVLPIAQREFIMNTPRSSTSDTTIGQYLVQNVEYINSVDDIISVSQLKGAGTGGLDIMFGYRRDPLVSEFLIGFELQYLAPQLRGLEVEIPGWSSTAGLVITQPLAYNIKEGI